MTTFTTLSQMVAIHAQRNPNSTAITAPIAKSLSYESLSKLILRTGDKLNALGVGRGDRVGLVLPNCPEMATAFVAVASACTAAPLNMAYRADEFEFYLTDLKAKALLVAAGSDTPARVVAKKLGIAVLEIVALPEQGAGYFEITGQSIGTGIAAQSGLATTDDIALVLHTSGTTSRPKMYL